MTDYDALTPVAPFDGWWAKRDDLAFHTSALYPSGSKVRQYHRMASAQPGAPMIVGCSAGSAMQIYVAAAAKQFGVPGIVYTAGRAKRLAATQYAIDMGCEVIEVRKGAYLSVLRSRARERAKGLGSYVRWDPTGAMTDTMLQCANLPEGVRRIIVPTGSGLICAGVMAGLTMHWVGAMPQVVAVAVSDMATRTDIISKAGELVLMSGAKRKLPRLRLVPPRVDYDAWEAAVLPDGGILDPYYAAKALRYVRQGDCLWLPGLRPLAAMPHPCQDALAALAGVPSRVA